MPINSIFLRFPGGLAKCLTLSYDDGVLEDIRLAEIMKQHGLRGTFNLNTGLYRNENKPITDDKPGHRLTKAQATELFSQDGIEPAIHAHMHSHLQTLPQAQVAYEILKDREILEAQFGKPVRGMAYPFGTVACTDDVVEALKVCGVTYARTTVSTEKFDVPTDWLRMPATCHHNDSRLMALADRFLTMHRRTIDPCQMFYLWGHSYEFAQQNNWEVIEKFAETVGNRDDIWYANNMQVYQYVEAYRALEFSANGNMVYNPSALTVWFTTGGINVKVEPGETVKIR